MVLISWDAAWLWHWRHWRRGRRNRTSAPAHADVCAGTDAYASTSVIRAPTSLTLSTMVGAPYGGTAWISPTIYVWSSGRWVAHPLPWKLIHISVTIPMTGLPSGLFHYVHMDYAFYGSEGGTYASEWITDYTSGAFHDVKSCWT